MRYDLHVHTKQSPCSTMEPSELVKVAESRNLDGVAVTDHDTTSAVDSVKEQASELEVISGVEITTSEGHIIGLDIDSAPGKHLSPMEAVEYIHSEGGYAILAHPFDSFRQRFTQDTLRTLSDVIDAVETVNSRSLIPRFNSMALNYAQRNSIRATGGSDSHFPFEVGRAFTETEKPILEALEEGSLEPQGRGVYLSGHCATKLNDLIDLLKK